MVEDEGCRHVACHHHEVEPPVSCHHHSVEEVAAVVVGHPHPGVDLLQGLYSFSLILLLGAAVCQERGWARSGSWCSLNLHEFLGFIFTPSNSLNFAVYYNMSLNPLEDGCSSSLKTY